MKGKFLKIFSHTPIVLLFLACTPGAHPSSDSAPQGEYSATYSNGKTTLSPPPAPGKIALRNFTKSVLQRVPCGHKEFSRVFMEEIEKYGAMPLADIIDEFSNVLRANPTYGKRLGVSPGGPNNLSTLLEKTLQEAGSLPDSQKRRILVRSLSSQKSFEDPSSMDAVLYHRPPIPLPPELKKKPLGILSRSELISLGGSDFFDSILEYTTEGFGPMGAFEASDYGYRESKKPLSDNKYGKMSNVINKTLPRLPKVETPVYRGMAHVDSRTIKAWIKAQSMNNPVYLGPLHNEYVFRPQTASATWDLFKALQFTSVSNPTGGLEFGVFLEMHNHHGVGIENVSKFIDEAEVLIPKDRKFRVEKISAIERQPRLVLIKMVGVDTP